MQKISSIFRVLGTFSRAHPNAQIKVNKHAEKKKHEGNEKRKEKKSWNGLNEANQVKGTNRREVKEKKIVKINENRFKMEKPEEKLAVYLEKWVWFVRSFVRCCFSRSPTRDKHLDLDLLLNAHLFVLRFWCIFVGFPLHRLRWEYVCCSVRERIQGQTDEIESRGWKRREIKSASHQPLFTLSA